MNGHLPDSGSISRACPNLRQLHGFMSHQVDICRVKSTYVALGRGVFFFLTIMLGFANVSSPSMMGCGQLNYGQFTDLQRPYFTFGFSLGESHGFSGPGQTLLNSDAVIAREGRPQGAPLPIQATSRGFVPIRWFFYLKPVVRSTDDSTYRQNKYITHLMSIVGSIRGYSHFAKFSTRKDVLRSVLSSLPFPGDELAIVSASPLFST